jgi:hypothetical protein
MDHETARDRLTELALGHLDEATARRVEAHAATCADCREQLRFVRVLGDALRERAEEVLGIHPDAEDLARVALDEPGLTLDERARIGAHVRSCAVCRDALEMARGSTDPGWWKRARRAMRGAGGAAVAGIMVGAAAVAALWLAVPGPAPVPLTAPTVALDGVTRAVDELPVLALDADDRMAIVVIAVDPWNVRTEPGDFRVEITIDDTWSRTSAASDLWSDALERTRLVLPRTALPDGSHTLRLRVAGDGTLIHESRFEVRGR